MTSYDEQGELSSRDWPGDFALLEVCSAAEACVSADVVGREKGEGCVQPGEHDMEIVKCRAWMAMKSCQARSAD